jgi:outer membrane receptor protein involved in Fe transport
MFTVNVGLRAEAFRNGLEFRQVSDDFLAPVIATDWKFHFAPRVGFAGAFRNSAGRTAFRANYARMAQPPDFQFFLDNTIGDSLRTDIRRQGNPNLAFEEGSSVEAGVSHLFWDRVGLEVVG